MIFPLHDPDHFPTLLGTPLKFRRSDWFCAACKVRWPCLVVQEAAIARGAQLQLHEKQQDNN